MADTNGMSIINTHIKNKAYSNIYLLGGNEKYLITQYKEKLLSEIVDINDNMNYVVYKGEGAKSDSIIEFASTMPFFADHRVVLVEDSDFFKKGNEEIEKLLAELPETTIIVFVESNIDKRNRLYKLVSKSGTVAMFDTPDEKTLLIWIKSLFTKENIKIEDSAVYRLIEGVGMDMNNLANEAEKLKCYCLDKGVVTVDDVNILSINQVEGKIFDMMDALSKGDRRTTLNLYNDLLLLREPAMRILYLITRQFNILLKTKLALEGGSDNSKIASVVKVPPFTVKKYVKFCENYTCSQLLKCVNRCQETDTNIKSGLMKDHLAVEMLIVDLLK